MGNVMESCGLGSNSYLTNDDNSNNNNKNGKHNSNSNGNDMSNDAVISALLMYCGFMNVAELELCDPNTLKKFTMAHTAQSRFLVEHKMDGRERWLLNQEKVLIMMKQQQQVVAKSSLLEDSMDTSFMDESIISENNTNNSNEKEKIKEHLLLVSDQNKNKNKTAGGVLGRYYGSDEGASADEGINAPAMKDEGSSILCVTVHANFSRFYHDMYLSRFPQHVIEKGSAQARTGDFVTVPNMAVDAEQEQNMILPRSALSYDSDQRTNDSPRSVRFSSSRSMFMNLNIQGSLGLLTGLEGDSSGNINIHEASTSPSRNKGSSLLSKQLVVLDRSSRSPVAVCTLKSRYGPPVVLIHSPKPSLFCQAPSTGIKFEGRALYPWAEFRVEGEFPLPVRYSVHLAIGNDRFNSEPSYRGSHLKVGSPDISVVGKTDTESSMRGCAIITLGRGNKPNDRFYISIAKGVDPSLFLCFAAIVDETLEHTMRAQFLNSKKDCSK